MLQPSLCNGVPDDSVAVSIIRHRSARPLAFLQAECISMLADSTDPHSRAWASTKSPPVTGSHSDATVTWW